MHCSLLPCGGVAETATSLSGGIMRRRLEGSPVHGVEVSYHTKEQQLSSLRTSSQRSMHRENSSLSFTQGTLGQKWHELS